MSKKIELINFAMTVLGKKIEQTNVPPMWKSMKKLCVVWLVWKNKDFLLTFWDILFFKIKIALQMFWCRIYINYSRLLLNILWYAMKWNSVDMIYIVNINRTLLTDLSLWSHLLLLHLCLGIWVLSSGKWVEKNKSYLFTMSVIIYPATLSVGHLLLISDDITAQKYFLLITDNYCYISTFETRILMKWSRAPFELNVWTACSTKVNILRNCWT